MKIKLINKNYIVDHLSLKKELCATVEIICNNEEELMTILKNLINLDVPSSPSNPNCKVSGVHHSSEKSSDEYNLDGPISTIEIE